MTERKKMGRRKKKLSFSAPGILEMIVDRFHSIPKTARIADVGCGSGALLSILHSMGYKDLTGYERPNVIGERSLEEYSKIPWREVPLNLDAHKDREEAFAAKDGYDVIICSEVLEHVYSPFECIRDFLINLNTGGNLIITIPNAFSVWSSYRRLTKGSSRWFERRSEMNKEVRASIDKTTHHLNSIDPICVDEFVRHRVAGHYRLVYVDGNNLWRDKIRFDSGWVPDPEEGDYWEQLDSIASGKIEEKIASRASIEQASPYCDCILLQYRKAPQ